MRHKKKRASEEIQLNLAAMLDMAFQLLTFFILTFKPPPIEAQITLRLPPPRPTDTAGTVAVGDDTKVDTADILKGEESLGIAVYAATKAGGAAGADVGKVGSMAYQIGKTKVQLSPNPIDLTRTIQGVFEKNRFIKQVVVQVDNELKYSELMKVVEALMRVDVEEDGKKKKLTKLSFVPDKKK